jgi:hypothetical protein
VSLAASAGNVQGSFSHTHFFNETGTFVYTDTRYTNAMTGVINVGDFVVSVASKVSLSPFKSQEFSKQKKPTLGIILERDCQLRSHTSTLYMAATTYVVNVRDFVVSALQVS